MKPKDQQLLQEAYTTVMLTQMINKLISGLDVSMRQSPSVRNLYSQWNDIFNMYNVYGMENKETILNSLKQLKNSIDQQYNITDSNKFSQGVDAPTSQINRLISTLSQA